MSNLSKAFGAKFDKDAIRIRSFVFNGHTFKVKVPLAGEYEALFETVNNAEESKVLQYYQELTKDLLANKDKVKPEEEVQFTEDDVIVQGRSMKEAAKNKAITEQRIVGLIRLLVPEEKDFDMSTVTYDMVEELFPFPVQLELIEHIANTISPNYKETRGK
jgi:hypothetical protein